MAFLYLISHIVWVPFADVQCDEAEKEKRKGGSGKAKKGTRSPLPKRRACLAAWFPLLRGPREPRRTSGRAGGRVLGAARSVSC